MPGERERGREREREREILDILRLNFISHRYKKTGKQTEKDRHGVTGRQTNLETSKQINKQVERNIHTYRPSDRQMERKSVLGHWKL